MTFLRSLVQGWRNYRYWRAHERKHDALLRKVR